MTPPTPPHAPTAALCPSSRMEKTTSVSERVIIISSMRMGRGSYVLRDSSAEIPIRSCATDAVRWLLVARRKNVAKGYGKEGKVPLLQPSGGRNGKEPHCSKTATWYGKTCVVLIGPNTFAICQPVPGAIIVTTNVCSVLRTLCFIRGLLPQYSHRDNNL